MPCGVAADGWVARAVAAHGGDSAERRADTLTLMRLLKMGKLMRLVRIKRAFKDLSALQERGYLDSNMSAERGVLILGQLLLFLHIVGCVQFLSARLAGFADDTWVGRCHLSDETRPLLHESSSTKYIVSLYHAALQLGMGEGVSGHPQRTEEFALHLITFILGAATLAYLFASLAATLAERDPSELEFAAMLSTLKQYMRHAKMPRRLRANLLFYFETRFPGQKAFDEAKILAHLTRPLLEEVCLHRSASALERAFDLGDNALSPLSDPVRRELACMLERHVFVRGDDVIRKGEVSDTMFFIAAGVVDIIVGGADVPSDVPRDDGEGGGRVDGGGGTGGHDADDDADGGGGAGGGGVGGAAAASAAALADATCVIRSLSQGSFVGEMALLTADGKASATVRVADLPGYMEGFALSRSDFQRLVLRHPEFRKFIEAISHCRNAEERAEKSRRLDRGRASHDSQRDLSESSPASSRRPSSADSAAVEAESGPESSTSTARRPSTASRLSRDVSLRRLKAGRAQHGGTSGRQQRSSKVA